MDMLRLRERSKLLSTALRIALRLSVDSEPISSLFLSNESKNPANSSNRWVEMAHISAYSLRHRCAFSASSRALLPSHDVFVVVEDELVTPSRGVSLSVQMPAFCSRNAGNDINHKHKQQLAAQETRFSTTEDGV
uniref:Uncharacterized protein n=1 Tax=Anopheles culicifacies TaxID=139723 RepID=A0A182M4D4_9DIPT